MPHAQNGEASFICLYNAGLGGLEINFLPQFQFLAPSKCPKNVFIIYAGKTPNALKCALHSVLEH